jgi:hypothetical protein
MWIRIRCVIISFITARIQLTGPAHGKYFQGGCLQCGTKSFQLPFFPAGKRNAMGQSLSGLVAREAYKAGFVRPFVLPLVPGLAITSLLFCTNSVVGVRSFAVVLGFLFGLALWNLPHCVESMVYEKARAAVQRQIDEGEGCFGLVGYVISSNQTLATDAAVRGALDGLRSAGAVMFFYSIILVIYLAAHLPEAPESPRKVSLHHAPAGPLLLVLMCVCQCQCQCVCAGYF